MIPAVMIQVPTIGSASLIEIFWLLFGIAGLCIVGPNLWASIRDMEILAHTPPGELEAAKIILRGRVRRELLRVVKLFVFVMIGLYAMASPPIMHPDRTSLSGLLVTTGLFVISAIISGQSYLDRRESEGARRALAERRLP